MWVKEDEDFSKDRIRKSPKPEDRGKVEQRLAEACRIYYEGYNTETEVSLYKLAEARKDKVKFFGYVSLSELEAARQRGEVYNPDNHRWYMNLAWLLGVIRKYRMFVLRSPIVLSHLWRDNFMPQDSNAARGGRLSAFSRELGAAIKAGYTPILGEGMIVLRPSEVRRDSHFFNIDPSEAEVISAISAIILSVFKQIDDIFQAVDQPGKGFLNYIKYFLMGQREPEDSDFFDDLAHDIEFRGKKIEELDFFELVKMTTVFSKYGFFYVLSLDEKTVMQDFRKAAIDCQESLKVSVVDISSLKLTE